MKQVSLFLLSEEGAMSRSDVDLKPS